MAALKAAASALAGALLLLAGAEGLLRLAGAPPGELPANFEYLHVETRRPFFRAGSRQPDGRVMMEAGRPGAVPQVFLAPKPPGLKRVFLVGGSVAAPFGAYLVAQELERLEPGSRWEQVNCGMPAYSSAADLLTLRQALRHEPDALVVLSGNNEAFPQPRWPALAPLWARLAPLRLSALATRLGPAPAGSPALVTPEAAERRFEANLRAMAREGRAAGVPVVFCTLPAGLRDHPPSFGPYPDWDDAALAARHAWERGDAASAERLLRGRGEPQALFLRARALERLGRRREAVDAYLAAAEADRPGDRTSPRRNALIRRVAAEEEQPLADLESLVRGAAPDGLPGAELLTDACHWRHALYPHSAQAVARALLGLPPPAPPRAPGPYDAVEWQRVFSSAVIKTTQIRERSWSEEALAALGRLRALDPRRFAAATASLDAVAATVRHNGFAGQQQARESAESVWSHLGELLRRERDWAGAARAFAAARAAGPGRLRPRVGEAELAASRGLRARAASMAAALAEEQPYWPELGARARAWGGGAAQNAIMSASR